MDNVCHVWTIHSACSFAASSQAPHLPALSLVTAWSVSASPTLCPSAFSGGPQSFPEDCFLFMVATVACLFLLRDTTFIHLHAHLAQWSRSLADTSVSSHPSGEGSSLHSGSLLFALWYHHIYNIFNGQNNATYDTLLWAGVGRVLPITKGLESW